MAEAYNLHRSNGNSKELIIIDKNHSLQNAINDGIFTTKQIFWYIRESLTKSIFINNDLNNYPYRFECQNGGWISGKDIHTLDNSLIINLNHDIFKGIKSGQLYIKGSWIAYCPRINWSICVFADVNYYYYGSTYGNIEITSDEKDFSQPIGIFLLNEVQNTSGEQLFAKTFMAGTQIEELKIINIKR